MFPDDIFDELDSDYRSLYSAISIDTNAVELWRTDLIESTDFNNSLTLLDSYSKEFFIKNSLSNILIYGFYKNK